MAKLSQSQKDFLAEATSRYHAALPGSEAEELLESRGLRTADIENFKLGFVADPLRGHEMYAGMLAIPYLRRSSEGAWNVVSIRFRCIEDHDHREHYHGKYNTVAGDTPRVFNTMALIKSQDVVAICEGEIDAISATVSGVPAVGIAGVNTWKPHFSELFVGYEKVFIFADGDEPGREFANEIAKKLSNTRIIPSAPGKDVNDEFVESGAQFIREKVR